ncbi:hypothetical protein BS47DRAFT_1345676 [Hydnum rufescens UP504]|uniref:Uncharacterized protein n=1 Tax=Hydnum rufescens UP504 TaxID=1448309 RepID=A0A9P6DSL3_9AGAM|nr:hypothetical protein BS47DRAFT_1345676 [Hydnum rufescens UP504]
MDSLMPAQLVDRAEKLVKKLSSSDEFNKSPPGSPKCNLMLDRVLPAMLSGARGGEGGISNLLGPPGFSSALWSCMFALNPCKGQGQGE